MSSEAEERFLEDLPHEDEDLVFEEELSDLEFADNPEPVRF